MHTDAVKLIDKADVTRMTIAVWRKTSLPPSLPLSLSISQTVVANDSRYSFQFTHCTPFCYSSPLQSVFDVRRRQLKESDPQLNSNARTNYSTCLNMNCIKFLITSFSGSAPFVYVDVAPATTLNTTTPVTPELCISDLIKSKTVHGGAFRWLSYRQNVEINAFVIYDSSFEVKEKKNQISLA